MEETLSGQRVVKAFRRRETAVAAFRERNQAVYASGVYANTYTLLLMPLTNVLGNLFVIVVAGLGGWLSLRGEADVGMIATFIHQLPQGYHTRLSERAGNLSQGQRQMLAIARAVLADCRILVLDEATSSVDTRTEAHIQRALLRLRKGRTSLVIAHRLSTIRDADRVVVIDGGRTAEQGTHQELLDRRGFYHHLYVSQFKGVAI
ncbi:MAG: ABC transporter transmembrane domain-containing protein [Candidatus Latescibacterota bacterium]